MTKYYLEVYEELSEEESFTKQPQQFRKEVGSVEEGKALYETVKSLFEGLTVIKRVQLCNHDTGGSCEVIKW